LSTGTSELQDIRQTLSRLQARVRELTVEPSDEAAAVAPEADTEVAPLAIDLTPPQPGAGGLALVNAGVAELSTLTRLKDFPEYFVGFARRTGLRLLLLKRWSSGLQVFLEENVKLPPEARSKRRDGRAPIPSTKDDIFAAVAHDGTVYCGPVPQKHFPLDLTILLGRGARDRHIVVLPIPAQGHWNTFLYLDADEPGDPSLAAAGVLAHFALSRMCLLERGLQVRQGQVSAILNVELDRRRRSRDRQDPEPRSRPASEAVALSRGRVPEIDPFTTPTSPEPVARPLAPAGARRPATAPEDLQVFAEDRAPDPATPAAPVPTVVADTLRHALTPEIILRHSGELPALPRAACHIMAVIEDPRTTATRLEKALAMDQALTAKVLRIANSPFYGAARQITTVSEAIVRLGFVAIRNWTLVTAARSVFLAPGAGMLYQKIWRQSVLSAMGSQLVAQAVGRVQPEGVFVGGLMQNIGQLVLARSHPELFQEILAESAESGQPYHEVELRVLGFDHGELGALLLREWNLTEDLEDAVRWHHRFEQPDARNVRVAAMIALGEEIARCQGGDEGEVDPAVDASAAAALRPAASLLGLTPERVTDLVKRAGALKIDPHFFS
jgi:HD-like signal output (HDOD) protein